MITLKYLPFLALSFTFLWGSANENNMTEESPMTFNYYPVKPSIYILLRKDLTYEGIFDWTQIVNAALPDSMKNDDLSGLVDWENIIIVDEGHYWSVSLHHRGNGMLSFSESVNGLKDWAMTIEDGDGVIVYLDKKTLMKVAPPKNGFVAAPMPWNPKIKQTEKATTGKVEDFIIMNNKTPAPSEPASDTTPEKEE